MDDDASFAGQRLWGANPLVIERVRKASDLPDALAIKDGSGPGGIKFDSAINEGRLYICDYSNLGFLAGPGESMMPLHGGLFLVDLPCQKYLTAPIGLFYWDGPLNPKGRLLPYAIQLEQHENAAVFTPKESFVNTTIVNWRIAKAAFQVAFAQTHKWDSLLIRTHMILAPSAISSERHLHPDHPALVLKRPHLRYTLKINSETGKITDKYSYGDVLLAPKHEDLMDLLGHYYERYMNRGFHQMANLENELSARNMGESEAPIHYPYRDNGLPIYRTIREFITNHLNLYYQNDREVREDRELQALVKELTDDNLGGVKGLTTNGDSIDGLGDLIDVLTNMIWTAGPAHSAVNYGQWDYMADPHNMPLSGYLEEPQQPGSPSLPPARIIFPAILSCQAAGWAHVCLRHLSHGYAGVLSA